MVKEIVIPKLGETIKEATIDKWRKKEGDKVTKGEVLIEITTDKAVLEVESFHDGFLKKIFKKEGDKVPVLSVIGYIADSMDEEIPEKIEQEHKDISSKTFSCPLNVNPVRDRKR